MNDTRDDAINDLSERVDELEGLLTILVNEAEEVTTGENTLVFRYARPTQRDVVRRYVLERRGQLRTFTMTLGPDGWVDQQA
jgi:hypothetical protein